MNDIVYYSVFYKRDADTNQWLIEGSTRLRKAFLCINKAHVKKRKFMTFKYASLKFV